ncbi:Hypothetical protein A7982_01306 [Minicystis rosea]|nr:Hypothetical protein A7982_01306 [Minicystis rosea]
MTRRWASFALPIVLGGLPACNAISGVSEIAFVTCDIHLGTVENTPLGGGDGGEMFDDACPAGQVLVGFQSGTVDGGVPLSSLGALCATVGLSSGKSSTLSLTAGATLPSHGTQPATNIRTVTCPADQVVVGFEGRAFTDTETSGTYLSRLAIRCAPLVVTGLPDAPATARGAITTMSSLGDGLDDGAVPIAAIDCPEGQVAVATRGQSVAVVDALGLGCAPPTITCDQGE